MKAIYWVGIVLALLNIGCAKPSIKVINVYPDQVITENFLGNGVQWSAYPHADCENAEWGLLMTDEKWQMNYHRLDYMQPKMLRVFDQANWRYLVGFDKENNPVYNFENDEVKAVERILTYAQQNNIVVMLGEVGTPFKVHDMDAGYSDMFTGATDMKWISGIVAYLDYLINTKGFTCIKYFNFINEPNGDWASVKGDFNEWREGVKLLVGELEETGLDKYVSVAGPDAVTRYDNPNSQYTGAGWVEQTAQQIDELIGIYEVHDYTDHDLVRSGGFKDYHGNIARFAKERNKQIIFGELGFSRNGEANQQKALDDPYACEDSQMEVYEHSYGIYMADAVIQSMNAGYSGAVAWALDDAMHTCGDLGNKNELKRWGMWNSLGTELCNNPADEDIRPWFYSWSLMCRYFPAGSSIVKTDTTGIEGVRLTAGVYKNDVSVAIVNNSGADNRIALNIPANKAMYKYLYSEWTSIFDENGFPLPVAQNLRAEEAIEIMIPANSFVLLTTSVL